MTDSKRANTQPEPARLKPAGFAPLTRDADGHELGFTSGEKFEFTAEHSSLLGVLTGKKQANIPDEPWVYQIRNVNGEFWFWGGTILDSRLAEVSPGSIVDITYIGMQKPTAGTREYKNFTVLMFDSPKGFNNEKHTVGVSRNGQGIEFFDLPGHSARHAKPSSEETG